MSAMRENVEYRTEEPACGQARKRRNKKVKVKI
jgi:hypothetical protein